MESKESLTNENLRKRFKSQFELVNYAIKLAENMIKTGRDARVRTEAQNRALQIIVEIETGKDQFDEIPQQEISFANDQINGYPSEDNSKQNMLENRKKFREPRNK